MNLQQKEHTDRGKIRYILPLLLVVGFWLLFSPSLFYPFINFDDDVYLYNNPLVTDFRFDRLGEVFSSDHTALFSPLVIFSYALEYRLWGLNPAGYRLVNFLLHCGSILLLYFLCLDLFGGHRRSFVVACLFALHPLRIESLVWVTERKDVLFVFLVLLTLTLYLRYLRRKDSRFYLGALTALSLAMLAKVSAFVTLPLLLLLDWWEGRKFDRRMVLDKIPLALVVLLLGLTGVGFLVTAKYGIEQGAARMALNALGIPLFLVSRFFWPFKLSIRYPLQIEALLQPLWLYLLLTALFFCLSGWLARWSRRWLWGLSAFLIACIPVLGALWRMFPMADRYSYLPSIGLGLMVYEALFSERLETVIPGFAGKAVKWAGMVSMSGVMVYGALVYLPVWRGNMSLWTHVLSLDPKSEVAYNNRALVFMEEGRYREAVADLDRAIRYYPDYSEAFWNRGICFNRLNCFQDADRDLFQAAFREPARFESLLQAVQNGEMRNGYQRLAAIGEELSRQGARNDLAFLYHMARINAELGRWTTAERYIESALEQGENEPVLLQLREQIKNSEKK